MLEKEIRAELVDDLTRKVAVIADLQIDRDYKRDRIRSVVSEWIDVIVRTVEQHATNP